jgi:preprotein translocase subunit SecD
MRWNTRYRAAGVMGALIVAALCVGCGSSGDRNVTLELRIVELAPADNLTGMTMTVWNGQKTYYAHKEIVLTEQDVKGAMAVVNSGAPAVQLVFVGEAQEKLRRVTEQNVGRRLGIVINGKLQCAPRIDGPNETGLVMMTGHMLERDAELYSRVLPQGIQDRSNPMLSEVTRVSGSSST